MKKLILILGLIWGYGVFAINLNIPLDNYTITFTDSADSSSSYKRWQEVSNLGGIGGTCLSTGLQQGSYRLNATVSGIGTISFRRKIPLVGSVYGGSSSANLNFYAQGRGSFYFYGYENSNWVEESIDLYTTGTHTVYWSTYVDTDYTFAPTSVLIDNVKWTPAPEKITVKFANTNQGSMSWKFSAGDKFGETLDNFAPERDGYTFDGWYYDAEFKKQVLATDYVPFSGAAIYAKWTRDISTLNTDEMYFVSNTENAWYVVEKTYSDESNFAEMKSSSSDDCPELRISLKGAYFFAFDLLGFEDIYRVDVVIDNEVYNSYLWDISTFRAALDDGEHTIVVRPARGFMSPIGGKLSVGNVTAEKIEPATSIGQWFARLWDYRYWTEDNLETLKNAECVKIENHSVDAETRNKAAIKAALAALLQTAEEPDVRKTLADLGYEACLGALRIEGKLVDLDVTPQSNELIQRARVVALKHIIEAQEMLSKIDPNWNGYTVIDNEDLGLEIDEEVYIDYGDVLYLSSFLKAVRAQLEWITSYNLELDYNQVKKDFALAEIRYLGDVPLTINDERWSSVNSIKLKGRGGEVSAKFARVGTNLYIKGRFAAENCFVRVCIGDNQIIVPKKIGNAYLYEQGTTVTYDDEMQIVVPISAPEEYLNHNDSLSVKNIYLDTWDQMTGWHAYEYNYINDNSLVPLLYQKGLFDKVNDVERLDSAKLLLKGALVAARDADGWITENRHDAYTHLFNYDIADQEVLDKVRDNIGFVISSLDSAQNLDWERQLPEECSKPENLDSPLSIYLGALFGENINRSNIPEFGNDYTVDFGSVKDITGYGLLPEMTQKKAYALMDEFGLSYIPAYNQSIVITSNKESASEFSLSTTISLSAGDNATIFYTLNGEEPTSASPIYTGPISINKTTVVKCYAYDDALEDRGRTYTFTLTRVAALDASLVVTPNIESGSRFVDQQDIVFELKEGEEIWYTLDGSDPKTSATRVKYVDAICITDSTTLKYYAINEYGDYGDVQTAVYTKRLADNAWYSEVIDGITWKFFVENGNATNVYNMYDENCSVADLIIPSVLGNCPVVDFQMFNSFNRELTSVRVPASVQTIWAGAIFGGSKLTDVWFEGDIIPEISLRGNVVSANVCPIHASDFVYHLTPACQAKRRSRILWGEWVMVDGEEEIGESDGGAANTVVVKQEVVHYVMNSVQPEFVKPMSEDTGFVNVITEIKGNNVAVPQTWAENYPKFVAKFGGDFTKALTAKSGKIAAGGREMLVWEDYVAGTDPTNPNDKFTASVTIVDGKPVVSYTPELDDARKALRKYTTYGKVKLTDTEWIVVPEGEEANYNFFKVSVEMK